MRLLKIKKADSSGGGNSLAMIVTLLILGAILVIGFILLGGGLSSISNLWTSLSSKANVDNQKLGCESACATAQTASWCKDVRTISYNSIIDGKEKISKVALTCEKWANNQFSETNADEVAAKPVLSNLLNKCPTISC